MLSVEKLSNDTSQTRIKEIMKILNGLNDLQISKNRGNKLDANQEERLARAVSLNLGREPAVEDRLLERRDVALVDVRGAAVEAPRRGRCVVQVHAVPAALAARRVLLRPVCDKQPSVGLQGHSGRACHGCGDSQSFACRK